MRVLVTGGDGMLGTELQKHLDAKFFSRADMDITNTKVTFETIYKEHPGIILHLAAYTDVAEAERDPGIAWATNVIGTRNIVRVAKFIGSKVIYISTDYVFDGERGGYEPWDPPSPVNYYAMTKLAGECVVSSMPSSLIIRTSFKPSEFPHPKVVEDMWTSADYVDVIAPKIPKLLGHAGIHHLGTGRKSLHDLIKQRNPGVGSIKRADVKSVALPYDVSFGNTPHWDWPST